MDSDNFLKDAEHEEEELITLKGMYKECITKG